MRFFKKALDARLFLMYVLFIKCYQTDADMAELVDATDLKSVGTLLPCRFDSGFPHHKKPALVAGFLWYGTVRSDVGTGQVPVWWQGAQPCTADRTPKAVASVNAAINRAPADLHLRIFVLLTSYFFYVLQRLTRNRKPKIRIILYFLSLEFFIPITRSKTYLTKLC